MVAKKVLVLKAPGTNCDFEMKQALAQAGAKCELRFFFEIEEKPELLWDYSMLVIPGGFSYGDYLGSGKIWALFLETALGRELRKFVASGRFVLGVCNGFQVLVKLGLLPGWFEDGTQQVSLASNTSGQFTCRWVNLNFEQKSVFFKRLMTHDSRLTTSLELPIAHGEGRFVTLNNATRKRLWKENLVFLRYKGDNPNGSEDAIAGITNPQGNVVGLMPHPERFVNRWQHYNWQANEKMVPWGLEFFRALIRCLN